MPRRWRCGACRRRHTWVPPYREICKTCVGAAALPRPSDMRRLSFGRGRTPPLRITWSAARVERATARVAPTQGLGRGGQRRGVGEIGEAPPVAEEASRFRGSAPIGGHDSGRESVGTTVGNRRPLRIFCSFSVGRHPCVPPPIHHRTPAAGHTDPALQSFCRFRRGDAHIVPPNYAPHPLKTVIANQRARWCGDPRPLSFSLIAKKETPSGASF